MEIVQTADSKVQKVGELQKWGKVGGEAANLFGWRGVKTFMA